MSAALFKNPTIVCLFNSCDDILLLYTDQRGFRWQYTQK